MLAGINDENFDNNENTMCPKIWNMVTEFKVHIEKEKKTIERDIRNIETQRDQFGESLKMLLGMKRQVEAT